MRERMSMAAAVLVSALGCSSAGQNLEPAPAAEKVAGLEGAATATDSNVTVIAQADRWPGDAWITEEVTPARVVITNESEHPFRIRYRDFVLVARDDERFAAIPPLKAEGEVSEREPLEPTYWTYRDFEVAPYYGGYYSGVLVYEGGFDFDRGYYDDYADAWKTDELPTDEMLAWSLPEGVLLPGGTVEGYLYFEHVTEDETRVHFETNLESADADIERVNVSIPFMVTEE